MNLKSIPYQTVEIIPLVTQYKVKRVSGQSRVPVLCDGKTVIVDSTEIALWLDTAWPEPRLIPEDFAARQQVLLWEDWADEAFAMPVRAVGFDAVRQDPAKGRGQLAPFGNAMDLIMPHAVPLATRAMMLHYRIDRAEIDAAFVRLDRYLSFLTAVVADREWLVGEQLTLADIAVASIARNLDPVDRLRGDARFARFFAWRDRVLTRCGIVV